jgi:hypothetical protein
MILNINFMKKKKLKKIFEKSLNDFKNKVDRNKSKSEKVKYSIEPAAHNQFNDYMFSESDDNTKEKTRNMIFRLLKLRDNLSINIHEKSINISSDYGLKKSNLNYNQSYNSSEYFSLEIIKETGYILTYKDKRVAFKDTTLYDDTVSKVTEIFKELNTDNFTDLYNDIMVESGLARESNLDDLLKS